MINIDNDKKVIQPYVSVGDKWCTVKKGSVMVNGEWQTVFEKDRYYVRLYSYGVNYKTLSYTDGGFVGLPWAPLRYGEDVSHYGWTTVAGSNVREYTSNEGIKNKIDMDLHAIYRYYSVTTELQTDATSSATVSQITITGYGPDTVEIEGCLQKVTTDISSGEVLETVYQGYDLKTDGTTPYVKVNNTYVSGTLGDSSGSTVISADVVRNDVVSVCGIADVVEDNASAGTRTTYTYKLIVHHREYSGEIKFRSAKE